MQFVPCVDGRRILEWFGNKLVPVDHGCTTVITDASREDIEEEQTTRDLPPTEVAHAGTAPNMGCKSAITIGNIFRSLLDSLDRDIGFLCSAFEGVFGIKGFQDPLKRLKGNWRLVIRD